MTRKFFELGIGAAVPHWIYHRTRGDDDWWAIDVDGATPLSGTFPLLTIECERKQKIPDFFKSGSKPIVSQRFREICEAFNVPAEFLPIKVLDPTGVPVTGGPFWFMHVLERLDCIDYQLSEFEAWSERPDSEFRQVSKLVLREDAIGDRHLLKPKRYSQLFVSEQLCDSLLKAKCRMMTTPLERVVLGSKLKARRPN